MRHSQCTCDTVDRDVKCPNSFRNWITHLSCSRSNFNNSRYLSMSNLTGVHTDSPDITMQLILILFISMKLRYSGATYHYIYILLSIDFDTSVYINVWGFKQGIEPCVFYFYIESCVFNTSFFKGRKDILIFNRSINPYTNNVFLEYCITR